MSVADDVLNDLKARISKTIDDLRRELSTVRTGRASLHLLDGVRVDYYGTPTPLNQVGNMSIPDATLITLQPWDASLLGAIEKAIRSAGLDLNPQNDGKVIRIPVPSLTEERRKLLVKNAHKQAEEGRVAIRNVRRDANDHLKKMMKDKAISEDDEKHAVTEVQKLTDHSIEQVNELLKKKEADIMAV
jgi:ribosome recycling factor